MVCQLYEHSGRFCCRSYLINAWQALWRPSILGKSDDLPIYEMASSHLDGRIRIQFPTHPRSGPLFLLLPEQIPVVLTPSIILHFGECRQSQLVRPNLTSHQLVEQRLEQLVNHRSFPAVQVNLAVNRLKDGDYLSLFVKGRNDNGPRRKELNVDVLLGSFARFKPGIVLWLCRVSNPMLDSR